MTLEQVALLRDLKRAPRTAQETLALLNQLMDEIWIIEIVPVRLNPDSDEFTLIMKAQFKSEPAETHSPDINLNFGS